MRLSTSVLFDTVERQCPTQHVIGRPCTWRRQGQEHVLPLEAIIHQEFHQNRSAISHGCLLGDSSCSVKLHFSSMASPTDSSESTAGDAINRTITCSSADPVRLGG